ncbi:hypothetical protein OAM45_02915 [Porticoccus sp.]|nr:hypothetical protein [Porticoccus sp.]
MRKKIFIDINSISVRFFAIIISLFATVYLINMPLVVALATRDLGLSHSEPLWLGGVFLVSFGLSAILSNLYILFLNWRGLIFNASVFGAASFTLSILITDFKFLLFFQGLSGFAVGTICSTAFLCLGVNKNPIRSYALTLCLQSFIVALVSYLLPPATAEVFSFQHTLMVASCFCLGSLILSQKIPKNIQDTEPEVSTAGSSQHRAYFFLVAILLIFLGGNIVKNTIEPIAYSAGFYMIILSLSSGIGALFVVLMETKSNCAKPILISLGIAIFILASGLFGFLPNQSTVIAFCFIGGAWNFSAAYLMGLFAETVNKRKHIPLIIIMQILGNIFSLICVGVLEVGQPYIIACIAWISAALLIFSLKRHNPKLFLVNNNE